MSFAYEVKDKVFAEYGGHLYEAKCEKRRIKNGQPQYFLKYFGFGKRNNRWQPESEVFPYNEENREVMLDRREAARQAEEEKRKARQRRRSSASRPGSKGDSGQPTPKRSKGARGSAGKGGNSSATRASTASSASGTSSAGETTVGKNSPAASSHTRTKSKSGSRKQGVSNGAKGTNAAPAAPGTLTISSVIKSSLSVPQSLSRNLVFQHLRLSDRMLVPLPRRPSVRDILRRFCQDAIEDKSAARQQEEAEFCKNIEVLFSAALGQRLLWSIERAQYLGWFKRRSVEPTEKQTTYFASIYGAEHLLRLLVLLPELLRVSVVPNLPIFQRDHATFLRELIEFLNVHQDELFTASYQPPPPEYLRLSHLAGL